MWLSVKSLDYQMFSQKQEGIFYFSLYYYTNAIKNF